jgi:serpin B
MGREFQIGSAVLIAGWFVPWGPGGALAGGPPPEVRAVVAANNQFALDLYGRLGKRDGNLFFSPYNINKALAMVYAGARGETEKEMGAALHFTLGQARQHRAFLEMRNFVNRGHGGFALVNPFRKAPDVQLHHAAGLWGQRGFGFQRGYLNLIRECYGSELQQVDFAAAEPARTQINAWVARHTHDKIGELFAPGTIDAGTRLVLATAIYFKGSWVHPFQKADTRDGNFWVTSGKAVEVRLMSQTDRFGYFEDEDLQGLQMPYQGGDLAMLVLLPRQRDGLARLEKSLSARQLASYLGRLRGQRVQVNLPRFKLDTAYDLNGPLASLGMKRAFGAGADLSGMNGGGPPLAISTVVHKAFVDVYEEGTEAAAATGVTATLGAVPRGEGPRIPVFLADHPYLFAVYEVRSGLVLFLGRYARP